MSLIRKFLRSAHLVAAESTREVQHGSVLVIDDSIVAAGCNLVPDQLKDVTNIDISATMAAIGLSAYNGVPVRGSWLYTTEPIPTALEAKMLIICGVRHVVRHAKYRQSGTNELLDLAGIETEYYEKPIGDFTLCRL